jgi:hypothetical protein
MEEPCLQQVHRRNLLSVEKGRVMSAVPDGAIGSDKILSLASRRHGGHQGSCTKRVAELEALVARLRAELEEAEAELQRERSRVPVPGDFVRCPLTNFFGRVTKVTPRPIGRSWVEIILYLGPGLPGHSAMDLFDRWELIDPPGESSSVPSPPDDTPRLPSVSSFNVLDKPALALQAPGDVESLIGSLWTNPERQGR